MREVNAFVEYDTKWQFQAMEQLVGADPEHDALHQIHLVDGPVEKWLQFRVQAFPPGTDPAKKVFKILLVDSAHVLHFAKLAKLPVPETITVLREASQLYPVL